MTGEMTIENVINRSCINLHMKGRDKKEVIEEMAEMFDRAGVLVDKAGYIKAVYERESEGPTGIGDQVAIPHGKTAAVGTARPVTLLSPSTAECSKVCR